MSSKKQLLAQFDFNNVIFNNSIDGITEDEANKKVVPTINPIVWIAGHAIWAQCNIAKLARVAIDITWAENFARGTGAPKPGDNAPTLAEIKTKWSEIYPQIRKGLENIPDEALGKKVEAKHPMMAIDDTLGGMWAFQNIHMAYTIGQLGVLRRGHNKEPMKFN